MKDKMTELEREFIEQYFLNYFNATKAYKETIKKIKGKEIKETTARANGWKYKEKLREEIEDKKKELKGSDDEIASLLALMKNKAEYDLTRLLRIKDGKVIVKDTDEWDALDKMVVDEIEQTKSGIKIKINRDYSLKMLAQYRGLLDQNYNNNISISTGLEELSFEQLKELAEKLNEEDGEDE